MSQPVLWPKNGFHPVGSSPPACLTQDLAPEVDAQVLLLGCGDPGSILYTAHANLGRKDRKLDFTCCDREAAIIARNVVLLTIAADAVDPEIAWSIFYDFFLDQTSYDVLLSQCRSLIQASSTSQTWAASKYNRYLRFCTAESLTDARRYWLLYVETETLPAEAKASHRDAFTSSMKSVLATHTASNDDLHCLQAAGPLLLAILEEGPKAYKRYWSSGITTSHSHSAVDQHLNPMFMYSLTGTKFNVHRRTNPILGFHLAPALTSIKGAHTPSKVEVEDIVQSALNQFSSWCTSFKDTVLSAQITIRLFVGEALSFCQALHTCRELGQVDTGVYAGPWGGLQINLTVADYAPTSPAPAPLSFNVIETMNLAEHVGLLNILVATTPLLQRKPQSVLLTNPVLPFYNDKARTPLASQACADIPTLCLLLGIAPSSHLSHFTTRSHQHEVLGGSVTMPSQYRETIPWKFPTHSVPGGAIADQKFDADLRTRLVCDPEDLANFIFCIFLDMFKDDNPSGSFLVKTTGHYTRSGFVAFLGLVKERVEVEWAQTVKRFIYLVGSDKTLLMGLANYQDLICHLYLRNLYIVDSLLPDHLERSRGTGDRFDGWNDMPSIVCVVLVVPRPHIKVLEDMDSDAIRTPTLQCESKGSTFYNIHASFQPIFGNIQLSEVEGEPRIVLNEDLAGWNGDSPLIVTFYMPSWILTYAPTDTQIGLFVRSTGRETESLQRKLGFMLTIYETSLADTEHVHISPHRPGNIGEVYRLREQRLISEDKFTKDGGNQRKVMIKFDPSRDYNHPRYHDRGWRRRISAHCKQFVFPYPVLGDQSKTRIARKSSYIEVESPIRANFGDGSDLNFNLNPFPVAWDGKLINVLSMHYINLDVLPALRLPLGKGKREWLSTHLRMILSEREHLNNQQQPSERGTLVSLQATINGLFLRACGLDDPHPVSEAFMLCNPSYGMGDQALIIVNEVKLDLSAHTVVLDAYVVPFTEENHNRITSLLPQLFSGNITKITTLDDETRAWRRLIPVLAERCRTWQHLDNCEYLAKGIPIDLDTFISSPLCGCGRGKDLGFFATVPGWTTLQEDATRVAIGPLFGFPSSENTKVLMKEMMDTVRDGVSQSRSISDSSSSITECAQCAGPGQPVLQACSVCKKTKYCSRGCQKSHWKVHKPQCSPATS